VHINADLANKLNAWSQTGQDPHEILTESKRKGLVVSVDEALQLSQKGKDFISKWTSGKPNSTYVRKPTVHEQPKEERSHSPFDRQQRQGNFREQRSRSY
jgi:hypothetical protein